MTRPPRQHPRRAFLMMDAVVGILFLTVLATLLVVSVTHQLRAQRQLDVLRAASRDAEFAADALLASQPLPASATVAWLTTPSPEPHHAWARVSVAGASVVVLAPGPAGGAQ